MLFLCFKGGRLSKKISELADGWFVLVVIRVLQFMFCADVIASVVLYVKTRKAGQIIPADK